MEAEIGDEVIVASIGSSLPGRVAIVVDVSATDGLRHYVVHWLAGDYDATIVPGSATKVEVLHKAHAVQADAAQR